MGLRHDIQRIFGMIIDQIKTLLRSLKRALKSDPNSFLRKVSGVVHVGGNLGQERELYGSHGLSVVWVEPIPDVFRQLNENIRGFKNQRAVQALVTDVDDQEYEFHIASNDGASSSILELKQHKDIWPGVYYTQTVLLRSITLASLFSREQIDASKYQALIMDTQGSELLVLRGSLPILRHFRFIKTEAADFESYEGCCRIADLDGFMSQHGFRQCSRSKFASRAEGGSYFEVVYERLPRKDTPPNGMAAAVH